MLKLRVIHLYLLENLHSKSIILLAAINSLANSPWFFTSADIYFEGYVRDRECDKEKIIVYDYLFWIYFLSVYLFISRHCQYFIALLFEERENIECSILRNELCKFIFFEKVNEVILDNLGENS